MNTGMDANLFAPAPREVESSGVLDLFTSARERFAEPAESPEEAKLSEAFAAFHRANPFVFGELERRALALLAAGAGRIGVKRLIEDMRDEWATRTTGDARQLNNSYTSRYARLLLEAHPDLRPLIQTRSLKSA